MKSLTTRTAGVAAAESDTDGGSARRLLRVLLSFKASEPYATADQLARRTGLPLSSTYRYLGMLREVGLVEDNGRQGFNIGAASIRLAEAARAANPLERVARPHLRQLVSDADETALVLRRVNDKAICVDGIEAPRIIHTPVKPGALVPIHLGAGPKILLAGLPALAREHMVKHCIRRHGIEPDAAKALRAALAEIAERGWAISRGEVFSDVFAVAAPIRDGLCWVASLTIAAPLFRLEPSTEARLCRLVVAAADAISDELSGRRERPAAQRSLTEALPMTVTDAACGD